MWLCDQTGGQLVDKIRRDQPLTTFDNGIVGQSFALIEIVETDGKAGQPWSVEVFPPEWRKSFGRRGSARRAAGSEEPC